MVTTARPAMQAGTRTTFSSADDVLDAIDRHTQYVVGVITDASKPAAVKIHAMEQFVGLVQGAVERRPGRRLRRVWRRLGR